MEIDLLDNVAQCVDRRGRLAQRRRLSVAQREVLKEFGAEYFDGVTGYGGYRYDGRHADAVGGMIRRYGLTPASKVLDVGCAKGFMLYEFVRHGLHDVTGCEISRYAVGEAHAGVRDRLVVMGADALGFADDAFDLVYVIDVVHNLTPARCDRAIQELSRVSRGACFLQVASYETEAQALALREWGVTVETFRDKDEWRRTFDRLGYSGDYFFKTFSP